MTPSREIIVGGACGGACAGRRAQGEVVTTINLRQLDSLGHSSRKWRRYYWAKHFIELREWDAARYFVGLLCGQNSWTMPGNWKELSHSVYPEPEVKT